MFAENLYGKLFFIATRMLNTRKHVRFPSEFFGLSGCTNSASDAPGSVAHLKAVKDHSGRQSTGCTDSQAVFVREKLKRVENDAQTIHDGISIRCSLVIHRNLKLSYSFNSPYREYRYSSEKVISKRHDKLRGRKARRVPRDLRKYESKEKIEYRNS